MSETPTPEQHPWYPDALRLFMEGKWRQLGITDPAELNILQQIYTAKQRGSVPSRLFWEARRIWDLHKGRILADWEWAPEELQALEAADATDTGCTTCPFCGCPGMN